MNEEFLKFETDGGNFIFTVEGDCCSTSMFYDFIGVKKLLNGGRVTAVEEVPLEGKDIFVKKERSSVMKDRKREDDDIKVYGYRLTTEDPQFGEVSSVFSFRNYSNGYYGGEMVDTPINDLSLPEITDDIIETSPSSHDD